MFCVREAELGCGGLQRFERCFPAKLAVAITAVVAQFKVQRMADELWLRRHLHFVQEAVLVMVVEFFDHTISPGLGYRDKPGLHSVVQTQANQGTHSARVSGAAVKGHIVVDLQVDRYPQPSPGWPNRVNNALGALGA